MGRQESMTTRFKKSARTQLPSLTGDLESVPSFHEFACRSKTERSSCSAVEDLTSLLLCRPVVDDWGLVECCDLQNGDADAVTNISVSMEGLSYNPVCFDEMKMDPTDWRELAATQMAPRPLERKVRPWERWLRQASTSRSISLLAPEPVAADKPICTGDRIPAIWALDPSLAMLKLFPKGEFIESKVIAIRISNLQVICPAADYLVFFEQDKSDLKDHEKDLVVLIQYMSDLGEHRRVCFLVNSARYRERFVSAVTALWQERRVVPARQKMW